MGFGQNYKRCVALDCSVSEVFYFVSVAVQPQSTDVAVDGSVFVYVYAPTPLKA